jgi:Pregnancy-associated plasma protein-A
MRTMRVSHCLFVILGVAMLSRALQAEHAESCVPPPADDPLSLSPEDREDLEQKMTLATTLFIGDAPIPKIPVHFTIFEGNHAPVRPPQLLQSMDRLNSVFNGKGIRFELASMAFHPEMFPDFDPMTNLDQEVELKTTYRRGGAESLNVFVVDFARSDMLGMTRLPMDGATLIDGILLSWMTLPGGPMMHSGATLVHEVGHWLGLLHLFEGQCNGIGDKVDDTVALRFPSHGCPIHVPSPCNTTSPPVKAGNFMDYLSDSCMLNFTDGQFKRMIDALIMFRSPKKT